ncbi:sigma-70 family RNA polymerase sigma factor [Streptosporangium sp. CA-115845]|uniref:sigma-70 family RNA polymerase sigma factor n=1 Tax=Streptosporangium sp. CA-115845 TaxID=3240071 RepID=UPI003D8C2E20
MTAVDNAPSPSQRRTANRSTTSAAGVDTVRDYLNHIAAIPLLSAEQEVDLARRIEAGVLAAERLASAGDHLPDTEHQQLRWLAEDGQYAMTVMVESNLRLVVSIAKRHVGRGLMFLDLIQEGNLGLIRAVQKFDYRKGCKLSTYATLWITQHVTRALADQGRTIRIPVHTVSVINRLTRLQRKLQSDLNRDPTIAELAAAANMPAAQVIELRGYDREPISLHTPVGVDSDGEFGDFIEDVDAPNGQDVVLAAMRHDQLRRSLRAALRRLPKQQATVMAMRYGLDGPPKSQHEAGALIGLSGQRVRQIERATLSSLRQALEAQAFREYLT